MNHALDVCFEDLTGRDAWLKYAVEVEGLLRELVEERRLIHDLPLAFPQWLILGEGFQPHGDMDVVVQRVGLVQRHEHLRRRHRLVLHLLPRFPIQARNSNF